MARCSNYDKFPFVPVGAAAECSVGWREIGARIHPLLERNRIVCIECYPGIFSREIADALRSSTAAPQIFYSEDCLKSPVDLRCMLGSLLGSDRVFSRMN